VNSNSHLPTGWALTSLGAIADVVRGVTFPASAKARSAGDGLIMCLRTTNVQTELTYQDVLYISADYVKRADQWLCDGDTVISMANSYELVGKVALARNPPAATSIGGFISIIRPVADCDPKFLYHQLASAETQEVLRRSSSQTVNIANLSVYRILPLELVLAPLPEQHRIVFAIESYFSRLDDAVAGLERVERNLKRYRASVLKAAVEGRLVPTEAELARSEGRDYEPAWVLLDRILEERRLNRERAGGRGKKYSDPAVPDPSRLPELPQGWCWATVQQLSTKVVDGVHKKPSYVEAGIPFVTVKNLTAGPGISFDHLKYISPEDHKEFVRRANPEEGDILISKDGTLGVVRAVRTRRDFSIFVSVAMVKPALRSMTDYLEVALSAPQVQRQMVPKGSGIQHIHLEDLREDCVPLAPLAEQLRIVIEVQRQLSIAEGLVGLAESTKIRCQRLRQSILRSAFDGKLADQDPTHEPASVLLERIRHEKAAAGAAVPRQRRRRRSR
jgi:type I restriction enzyme S subunit